MFCDDLQGPSDLRLARFASLVRIKCERRKPDLHERAPMEDMHVGVAVISREHANRIPMHFNDGRHIPYNLNAWV